jgi:predicted ArsR family transcriptional regulator
MQATREKIVEYLRKHGQGTVENLAEAVDLTSMAVRHHLNVLQAADLVEVSHTRRNNGPGRPVQIYALTDDARKSYPQEYFQLTDILLDEVADQIGPERLTSIFERIARRVTNQAPEAKAGQSFESRLDEAVQFLQERGFMAEWDVVEGQYIIRHLACPYRQLAQRHQEVCSLDEQIISNMLQIQPTRISCIANNDGECTYCLKPAPETPQNIELTLPQI